jgi:hypothetical protein
MTISATTRSHRMTRRLASAVIAPVLLTVAIVLAITHDTGYWQLFAFGLGPDIALFFGAGRGLERGQLHPRAVRFYNALHTIWLPIVLGAVALLGVVSFGYVVGALAWAFHITLDRAVGYGLRTRDGFQRS